MSAVPGQHPKTELVPDFVNNWHQASALRPVLSHPHPHEPVGSTLATKVPIEIMDKVR
jgi:hypothetical protein